MSTSTSVSRSPQTTLGTSKQCPGKVKMAMYDIDHISNRVLIDVKNMVTSTIYPIRVQREKVPLLFFVNSKYFIFSLESWSAL